jgi:prepilin-type N-terminal cleavage/methylation domain-containing protein
VVWYPFGGGKNMKNTRNAFTLMELLVVVVILGIIAAFGIPNYNRSQEKADEREAVSNLRIIAQALEMLKIRDGEYPNLDMPEFGDINSVLNLGIIEQNMDYNCSLPADSLPLCTAVSSYGWELRYDTQNIGFGVHCSELGGCPSCAAAYCSYIGMY